MSEQHRPSRARQSLVGHVLGSYRVLEVLGEGGMGVVYLGEHTSLGRKAAIKLLHPEFASQPEIVQRFFNEARAANRIEHPAIIDIYDFSHSDDGAFLVMEYLGGGVSLGERIVEGAAMPLELAALVIYRVASPLTAAHRQGIVHRDLKPDNIYLLGDPDHPGDLRVKLLDFGVAKLLEGTQGGMNTQTGTVLGTPHYMAPEQCHGAREIDHRADIYALGVIAYQLLTGRLPFVAEGLGELLIKHQIEPPPPLRSFNPELPTVVERHVLKALAKEPEQRFAAVEEFAEQLARMAGIKRTTEVTLPPTPEASIPPTVQVARAEPSHGGGDAAASSAPPARARRWMLLALLALTLATAVGVGWFIAFHGAEPAARGGTPPTPQGDARTPAVVVADAAPAAESQDGAPMVFVPAGPCWCGADDGPPAGRPRRRLHVGAFSIDRHEVTVGQYRRCVSAGACSARRLGGTELPGQVAFQPSAGCTWTRGARARRHPINCVDWRDAAAYCRWAGKRLPTEAEWEKAARGSEGRRWPWGSERPRCARAVLKGCAEGPVAVGSRSPAGDSPYGARDMIGNVAEWVADRYSADAWRRAAARDPRGPGRGRRRSVRGGSFTNAAGEVDATRRLGLPPGFRLEDLGFRCAIDGRVSPVAPGR